MQHKRTVTLPRAKKKMMRSTEDENLPATTDIVLIIDGSGEIVECIDAKKGRALRYEFVEQHSLPHKRLIHQHDSREHESMLSEEEELKQALATIRVGKKGLCILFNNFDVPSTHGFPFGIGDAAYCEGLLMCEIKGFDGEVLDDRSLSLLRFEMTTAFRGYEHVDPPGLMMSQQEKEDMCALVSPFHHALDPVLTMFNEKWRDSWGVGLSPGHFVGVYKSDWNGVARETCASSGHDVGVHYYVVVRGGLAETTAEQLIWLSKITSSDTWETRMLGPTLTKATEMARYARSTLLKRALDVLHVQQVGECVSTEWNIAKPAIYRLESNGSVDTRAAYYRQCTSSSECKTGVLTMGDNDAIVWLHGPPTATRGIGGKSWSNTEQANAFPVYRDVNESAFGHEQSWGKCILKPLFVIQ